MHTQAVPGLMLPGGCAAAVTQQCVPGLDLSALSRGGPDGDQVAGVFLRLHVCVCVCVICVSACVCVICVSACVCDLCVCMRATVYVYVSVLM